MKSYHVHITCLLIDNPGEDGAEGEADGAADLGTFPATFVAKRLCKLNHDVLTNHIQRVFVPKPDKSIRAVL